MKTQNIMMGLVLCLTGFYMGCSDSDKTEKTPEESTTEQAKDAKTAKTAKDPVQSKDKKQEESTPQESDTKEIVFDPTNPPAGYTKCHRNHCHKVGGGVASYKQVMEEMGATKIINAPKQGPMPKAPADVAAPPEDAETTASGLVSKMLKAGDGGAKPTINSKVTVHYTGWTSDGKAFDSSVARGEPATIPLDGVFPGWSEGLQLMTVGEERRFWIPQELAFKGQAGRPKGTIVFDVELLAIK